MRHAMVREIELATRKTPAAKTESTLRFLLMQHLQLLPRTRPMVLD